MTEEIGAPLPAALQPVEDAAFKDWYTQPPSEFTRDTDN
jgi:hypothetical protein